MTNPTILGIETSCDDNSVSILKDGKIISCIINNDAKELEEYKGIVPEIVSRFHEKKMLVSLEQALCEAKVDLSEIDIVAYTAKPGLIGSLLVGKTLALSLSYLLNKPIEAIDHITGHILSPFIDSIPIYPYLSLIASGKTTSIFLVKDVNDIELLNYTLDDAFGEALDKVGVCLDINYPAGPVFDKLFDENKAIIKLPSLPAKNKFSFSGVKSQMIKLIKTDQLNNNLQPKDVYASSFLKWGIDNIIKKLKYYQNIYHINTVTIGGGVAANTYFQKCIKSLFKNSFVPNKKYATDNAAMISYVAYLKAIKNN